MTSNDTNPQTQQSVDLTNCDKEPIHLLGNVQSYGCLIATSLDFMINHVSENVQDILGLDPEVCIGGRLVDIFPRQTIHDLRTKLQLLSLENSSVRLFSYDAMRDGVLYDISVHAHEKTYVFEFEKKGAVHGRDDMNLVQPLIARVKRAEGVTKACAQAAMAMQVLTGFDRVMVYKFDEDGSGEVIAERRQPQLEPFLGLRYPASDIPQQARALYMRSMIRLIADVDSAVSPILPQTNVSGSPLDLSLAVTRAVSPIHLEYLRNMGVAASMSVSIILNDKLWGLFACHHSTARYVDFERRTAIELFAQFFAYELSAKTEVEAREEDQNARQMHNRLMLRLSGGEDLINGFDVIAEELENLIPNDGVAVYSDGRFVSRGIAPNKEQFKKLSRFLNTAPAGVIYATHNLASVYPDTAELPKELAGLLAIPISRTPRDYIVFFRREIAKSVKWAGNPQKAVATGPNGQRLTPRKSFEAWSEIVRETSKRWSDTEQRIAESLRVSLIEIMFGLTDEANESRRKAAEKQEVLIAELNHRVRNILNLIRGLVAKSRESATDVISYAKVLDGRVQSLARAHDQLTKKDQTPSSLRQLIEVEVSAFLNNKRDRLIVTGDAPMLLPEAFSTMALVVHELVTNSVKYGALSGDTGSVAIDLRREADGALSITWREANGPPVSAPTRRGFGRTIIEKTIPYELKGDCETRYAVSGFEADMRIPAPYIADERDTTDYAEQATDAASDGVEVNLSGDVLVVEDNMIIALDASDILRDHGAKNVHLASTVAEAMDLLQSNAITFALLDVNLGSQTSLPVAKKLAAAGIPFVLATGYGDTKTIADSYPPTQIVNKPFTGETLLKGVRAALG